MADVPPGRGRESAEEPERDLGPDAYEATVPAQLSGFRGTNPLTFVLGGAIAFGILLIAFVSFVHRGSPPPNRVSSTSDGQAVPVGPGVGGGLQTPFIPEATAVPAVRVTLAPIIQIPTLAPQEPPVATAAPAVEPPPQVQTAVVPALAATTEPVGTDQMTIAQPSAGPASPAAAGAQGSGKTKYVPVFRNGKLVAVVPVPADVAPPATDQRTVAVAPAAPAGNLPDPSSQFVSNGTAGAGSSTGLGSANSGLIEARKFSNDHTSVTVGYAPIKSRRQLDAATVINARLLTKIESDLPGSVIAQVIQPVYDSATHTIVVIPAGSKLFGLYDEETVNTSNRLLLAWQRVVFPDGQEFDTGGLEASSANGTAGFDGDVDRHRGTLYTSAILLSVLAGAESAITPQQNNALSGPSVTSQVQAAAGAELAQTGNKILQQAIDRPATLIIRPPYVFQVIVTHDLPLDEYVAQHQ